MVYKEYAYSVPQNVHMFSLPIDGVIFIRRDGRYSTITNNIQLVDKSH